MRIFRAWLVLTLILAGGTEAATFQLKPVEYHADPRQSAPLWVSAAVASSEPGQLSSTLLPDLNLFVQKLKTMDTGEDCLYFGISELGDGESLGNAGQANLEELSVGAQGIVEGLVEGVDVGFYAQHPGAVLTINIVDQLVASSDYRQGDNVFLYYPEARFTVGDLEFCKEDARFSRRPEVGDRVLLFVLRTPRDADRRMIDPTPNGVFYSKPGGKLVVPPGLLGQPSLRGIDSVQGLKEEAGRILSGKGGKP